MAPLPNHHVIPPGWASHHRPVANSTMTAVCSINGPSGPPVWPATEPTPGAAYATGVNCRVQQQQREAEVSAVGQELHTREYLVTLPVAEVPAAALVVTDSGPYLTVTGYRAGYEQDGDPHLIGRTLKVQSVMKGSLLWERDLICVDDLTNGG